METFEFRREHTNSQTVCKETICIACISQGINFNPQIIYQAIHDVVYQWIHNYVNRTILLSVEKCDRDKLSIRNSYMELDRNRCS